MGFWVFPVCPLFFSSLQQAWVHMHNNDLCSSIRQLKKLRVLKAPAQLFSEKLEVFCFKLGKAKDESGIYDQGKSD